MLKQKISADIINTAEAKTRAKYQHVQDGSLAIQNIFADLDALVINSYSEALQVYFHIITALELNRAAQCIKEREKIKLLDMAEKCLRFCHIQAVTSQHSHLYSRLYTLIAENSLSVGQAWESVSQVMIGEYLGRDSKSSTQTSAWVRGVQAWQLGHLRIAKIALHTFDINRSVNDSYHREAMRLLIRIYRLSGETEQASARWDIYNAEFAKVPGLEYEIRLEQLICELQKGSDPKELFDFLQRNRNALTALELCLGQLWLCASRYRDIWVSFSSMKERKGKKGDPSSLVDQTGIAYLNSLEIFYNQEKPLQFRLEVLGKKLVDIRQAPDPELALLFLAGAIRWLNRSKQIAFASILIDEYKALSLRYSEGRTVDSTGLILDVIDQLPTVVDRDSVKHHSSLFVGTTPRFLKLAQVVSKASFMLGMLRLKPMNQEDRIKRRFEIHQEIYNDLEKVIGELKGPLMKVAQLAAANYFVENNSLKVMQGIYDQAPALPPEIMLKQIESELKRPVDEIFKEFDPKPIAVTSISEVFKATLPDGTLVAVKAIYPRIEEIMESDLRLFKMLTPLLRRIKSQQKIDGVIKQCSERFLKECDYEIEAATHQTVFDHFKGDRDILIPKVFRELSTKRIFVTEFIEGERLDHFLRHADQERRNEVSAQLLRFGMISVLKYGIVNIDPHLANFIVKDDKIVALDFGAVAVLTPELLQYYRKITAYKYFGMLEPIYELLNEMGYIDGKTLSRDEFLKGIGPHFLNPYDKDEVRLFYENEANSVIRYMVRTGSLDALNPKAEYFFANLATSVSEEVLGRLGARLNWHRLLGEILLEAGIIESLDSMRVVS